MANQSERMTRLFPRPTMRVPSEKNSVVQVKYTNPNDPHGSFKCLLHRHEASGKSMLLIQRVKRSFLPASASKDANLSSSGSNQAREGRLVNALAVRGDERRDTLR